MRGTLPAHKTAGVWRVTLPDRGADHQANYHIEYQETTTDQESDYQVVTVSEAARAQLAPLVAQITEQPHTIGRRETERDAAIRERDALRRAQETQELQQVARDLRPATTRLLLSSARGGGCSDRAHDGYRRASPD